MAYNKEYYDLYLDRLNIQDVLAYGGYKFNRKDGFKYPCFVRLDSDGRRIHGDKFVVMPGNKCCFHPPKMQSYNLISLIQEFPELFPESASGKRGSDLVHAVCQKILNMSPDERDIESITQQHESKPFKLDRYTVEKLDDNDQDSLKNFSRFFDCRGIGKMTQHLFKDCFVLATHETKKGRAITNLSFPMRIPGKKDIVGFEERGLPRLDGTSGYKGKAEGSNGSEGLWIGSTNNIKLKDAKDIYWFESAYDAMAYFQTHIQKDLKLHNAVFLSTGGTPTVMQYRGVINEAKGARHHLCFDNDMAGRQFEKNFQDVVNKMNPLSPLNVPEELRKFVDGIREFQSWDTGYRSWNRNYIPKIHELFDDEASYIEGLPPDLAKLQKDFIEARNKVWENDNTSLVAPDDKSEDRQRASEALKAFKTELLKRLHIEDGKDFDVDYVREVPKPGYKDWNEELLGESEKKRDGTVTTTVSTGMDLDGDGEEDTIEEERHVEDKKQQHLARHQR